MTKRMIRVSCARENLGENERYTVEITADVYGQVAVHRYAAYEGSKYWSVTHIQSGLLVNLRPTKREAVEFAKALKNIDLDAAWAARDPQTNILPGGVFTAIRDVITRLEAEGQS